MARGWTKWLFKTLTTGHFRILSKNDIKESDHYVWQCQACVSAAFVLVGNRGTSLAPRGRWYHAVLRDRSEILQEGSGGPWSGAGRGECGDRIRPLKAGY